MNRDNILLFISHNSASLYFLTTMNMVILYIMIVFPGIAIYSCNKQNSQKKQLATDILQWVTCRYLSIYKHVSVTISEWR